VTQQARNLVMQLGDGQPFRFLLHDRDAKFSNGFDEVFRSEGIRVIRTPVQAPNANAYAERWVRALQLQPPDGEGPTVLRATDHLRRRDLLGGVIHEYEAA
jgi:putative transposase